MTFYSIEPEVAGGPGARTVFKDQVTPGADMFVKLHYEFAGWGGDDFVCCQWGGFLVTEPLAAAVPAAGLSGASLVAVDVSVSELFAEVCPGVTLPRFVRLKVQGKAAQDDFGLAEDFQLVISRTAFDVLRRFKLEHATIAEFRT